MTTRPMTAYGLDMDDPEIRVQHPEIFGKPSTECILLSRIMASNKARIELNNKINQLSQIPEGRDTRKILEGEQLPSLEWIKESIKKSGFRIAIRPPNYESHWSNGSRWRYLSIAQYALYEGFERNEEGAEILQNNIMKAIRDVYSTEPYLQQEIKYAWVYYNHNNSGIPFQHKKSEVKIRLLDIKGHAKHNVELRLYPCLIGNQINVPRMFKAGIIIDKWFQTASFHLTFPSSEPEAPGSDFPDLNADFPLLNQMAKVQNK